MPDLDPDRDQVAEYLLGQLDPRARADFEARLATSPTLRAHLLELESACEVLALAAPQLPPPRLAWTQIAQRTAALAAPAPVPAPLPSNHAPLLQSLGSCLRHLWRGGWFAAAALALLWTARELTVGRLPDPSDPHHALQGQDADSHLVADTAIPALPGSSPFNPSSSAPSSAHRNPAGRLTSVTALESPEETRRLRAWVHQLALEVADLNRTLARQTNLPSGATPLQMFRLANASRSSVADPSGTLSAQAAAELEERRLHQWLASALAQQLVLIADDPGNGLGVPIPESGSLSDPSRNPSQTVTNFASTGGDDSPSSSFQIVELTSAVTDPLTGGFAGLNPLTRGHSSLHPGTEDAAAAPPPTSNPESTTPAVSAGVGFYSAETGRGSLALIAGQSYRADQSLQVWAVDNETGSTYSVGTLAPSEGPLLIQFTLDPSVIVNPGFLVTLEPVGGSASPTGPVIVGPPATPNPKP